jgi:hypothetical protein
MQPSDDVGRGFRADHDSIGAMAARVSPAARGRCQHLGRLRGPMFYRISGKNRERSLTDRDENRRHRKERPLTPIFDLPDILKVTAHEQKEYVLFDWTSFAIRLQPLQEAHAKALEFAKAKKNQGVHRRDFEAEKRSLPGLRGLVHEDMVSQAG